MTLSTELVAGMYAEYRQGASLSALARRYGRDRRSFREIFTRRGLELRTHPVPSKRDRITGCWLAAKPATATELERMIARATRVHVPQELAREWRLWPMERRLWFIGRLRERFPSTRPAGPFSANVEPFDYGSARAWAIVRRLNRGRCSRHKQASLKPCSEGVIWKNQLWFWCGSRTVKGPGDGYFLGKWRPGIGRPCLHHTIWEKTHGTAVPAKHTVIFLDGNKNNLAPENLALRSMADCVRMNQVWRRLRQDPLNPRLQGLADKIRKATIFARRKKSLACASLLFTNHKARNANLKLVGQMV
jgi:hypothetical protein